MQLGKCLGCFSPKILIISIGKAGSGSVFYEGCRKIYRILTPDIHLSNDFKASKNLKTCVTDSSHRMSASEWTPIRTMFFLPSWITEAERS